MRVIVVGLGVQGHKRRRFAGADFVASVDPVQSARPTSAISRRCRSTRYDAALLCIPDDPKVELLDYLVEHGKHVLVEKPLVAERRGSARRGSSSGARDKGVVLYTAYNHRFEPHYVRMRDLIASGALGRSIAAACSTATARRGWCAIPTWRDQGAGVLPDLGSHLLDTARFWFGDIGDDFSIVSADRFENRSARPRRVRDRRRTAAARIRNDAAELAQSFHLRRVRRERQRAYQSLCKWGPSDVHPSHAHPAERPAAGGDR